MKICKAFFSFVFFLSAVASGSAQSSGISMPKGPASPSMPSVSAPAIGNGFYAPGQAGFYQGQNKIPAAGKEEKQPDSSSSAAASSTAVTSPVSASASSVADQYSTANQISQALTASDLSSMDSLGMLGSFSNLLGGNSRNAVSASTDNVLLQRILSELQELKAGISSENPSGKNARFTEDKNVLPVAAANTAQTGPSILRFVINGNDVLSGCRTVFFSRPESDGSFLLTGDRKYAASGKTRSETFHLLFHATGTKNSSTSYNVSPALTQDWENTSSLLYKLCQNKKLTASRTGNLLTMRCTENGVTTDLLLNLE